MSQTQRQHQSAGGELADRSSPYATDDDWHYWERDADGTPIPPDELDGDDDDDLGATGTDPWSWVAHGILKDQAPLYDPFAIDEDDEEVELTEAHAFPHFYDQPGDEFRYAPRPYRVNEETGAMPTGPIIGNRPWEEFQKDVYAFLLGAVLLWQNTERSQHGVCHETAIEIWEVAEEMKTDGGPHDQTIMAAVARYVLNPRLLEEERE